jgi:hypothetical protein
MSLLIIVTLLMGGLTASAQENPSQEKGQPFRLEPGDFRWVPFTVRQTPAEIDCHFEVLQGNPSVHVELLPMSEFRLFNRGRDYAKLVATPEGRTGDFRRVIDVSGQYAVMVANGSNAPPATVLLQVRTTVNPDSKDTARTLSPERRLTVILISFSVFFVTVTWSSRKLIRAMRSSRA